MTKEVQHTQGLHRREAAQDEEVPLNIETVGTQDGIYTIGMIAAAGLQRNRFVAFVALEDGALQVVQNEAISVDWDLHGQMVEQRAQEASQEAPETSLEEIEAQLDELPEEEAIAALLESDWSEQDIGNYLERRDARAGIPPQPPEPAAEPSIAPPPSLEEEDDGPAPEGEAPAPDFSLLTPG